MPKGVYKRSEQHKKRIGEARRRYFDKHGRVVNVHQKDSPEEYREYQREYQKIWRKKFPNYYRDLKRKEKEVEEMKKLEEIVSKFNEIQVNCLEVKYGTSAFNEDKIKTLVEDFNKLMNNCIEELKQEQINEDKDAHK